MTRVRQGVNLEQHVAELERRRALMAAELEHLEAELEQRRLERRRYRAALERIAEAESGVWGWIAHEALYPDRPVVRPAKRRQA